MEKEAKSNKVCNFFSFLLHVVFSAMEFGCFDGWGHVMQVFFFNLNGLMHVGGLSFEASFPFYLVFLFGECDA